MKFIKHKMSFARAFVMMVFTGLLMSPFFIFGQAPPSTASKLAVTPAGYDDMGQILERLGYSATEISTNDLGDASTLSQYDSIYVNCSSGASYIDEEEAAVIKSYVQNGGTLYASDWAANIVEKAFPEKVKFYNEKDGDASDSQVGESGEQTAKVVDAGLESVLGKKEVKVNYDMGSWAVIDSVGSGTKVYIEGPVKVADSSSTDGYKSLQKKPYVVSFSSGKGQVLYTSFHNEAQNTEDMDKILNWFGIKTKAGKLAQKTNDLLEKDGNKVLQEVVDGINQNESKNYEFKATGEADFSVTLNFGGSAIEVTVTGPDGKKVTSKNVGTPPYTYEVNGAKEGTYKVSVKGTDIPEKNYPFVLAFSGPENAMVGLGDDIAAPTPKVAAKKDNTLLYVILAGVGVLIVGGSVVYLIIRSRKKKSAEKPVVPESPKEEPEEPNKEKGKK